jgi:hypothetical protein
MAGLFGRTNGRPRPESRKEPQVNIQKSKVIEILRQRDQDARADWVDREMPDIMDLQHHGGLLSTLHIDLAQLADESGAETADEPKQ